MIETMGLKKTYASQGMEVVAVDGIDLTVAAGEFILIFGRSGSGKSTLLSMLAGLVQPTGGSVLFRGTDISQLPDAALSGMRAREIGFVFQFSGLIMTLNVLENVMLPTLFTRSGPERESKALELLRKVGMSHRTLASPRTLSRGEMKRVAIARALMNSPSLLIADEPTGDLDVETEYEVMELFRQLNREGTTIVMVTHNPDLAPYGTQTYRMERGRITGVPGPTPLLSDPVPRNPHREDGDPAGSLQ